MDKEEEIKGVEEKPSKEEVTKQNKTFRNVMIVIAACVLMFAATYWLINYTKTFEYKGVNFEIIKTGQLTLYNTYLPVMYNGTKADYNFYLRKDPRTLNEIPFNGVLTTDSNMVLNMSNSLNCNGDGIIAIANLKNLYNVIGTNVIKDDNASCDPEGRYMYVNILTGNETKIEQFGPECYNIYISNCNILSGTEKFMTYTLAAANNMLKSSSQSSSA